MVAAAKSMMTGRPIGLKISQNLNKNLTRGITNRKILNKILKDFERSDHIMRAKSFKSSCSLQKELLYFVSESNEQKLE
jgi:hypothetical protein